MIRLQERSRAIVRTQEFLEQLSRDASRREDVRKSAHAFYGNIQAEVRYCVRGEFRRGLRLNMGSLRFSADSVHLVFCSAS
jgi:hypothetical protein